MLNKIDEVVISKLPVIYDCITENLKSYNINVSTKWISDINLSLFNSFPKIDLLIVDQNIQNKIKYQFLFNIKTIINFNLNQIRSDEIRIALPTKLFSLLNIILQNRWKKHIFCKLNESLIYDEQLSLLINKTANIKLTEKENKILKTLLLAPECKLHKKDLDTKIWNSSEGICSQTLEIHFSRLRQKLPKNFIEHNNNYYYLMLNK